MHGRTRKQFPFDQISVIEESTDLPNLVFIKFIKDDLVEDGLHIASGGQRDYKLTFPSQEIRDQFVKCLEPVLSSSVKYNNGQISFSVYKRLNFLQHGRRTLILDIVGKMMYNVEEDDKSQVKKKKKGAELYAQKSAEKALESGDIGDVRKKFAFADIVKIQDDASNLNKATLFFRGGQREYKIEFASPYQRKTFHKVMDPFVAKPITDAEVKLNIVYTHPQSRTNTFQHTVNVMKPVPTTGGGKANWTHNEVIEIPEVPGWHSRKWDISRGMTTSSLRGVGYKDMHATLCARHAKLCLVAYTMEAARRSAKLEEEHSVQFHVLDPGLMNTQYFNKAIGLGHMVSPMKCVEASADVCLQSSPYFHCSVRMDDAHLI